MSKYIIEIKPEYEDKFKGVMILGAENSNLYVDSNTVDELEELNSDYINEHFSDLKDTAYQRGFEDGKWKSEDGCTGCKYEGKTGEHLPCDYCMNNFKNRWTAKDDEIEVGDEVADKDGDKTIVTNIHGDLFDGLCSDGSTMTDLFLDDNHKTGRHFDIKGILEAMKHD